MARVFYKKRVKTQNCYSPTFLDCIYVLNQEYTNIFPKLSFIYLIAKNVWRIYPSAARRKRQLADVSVYRPQDNLTLIIFDQINHVTAHLEHFQTYTEQQNSITNSEKRLLYFTAAFVLCNKILYKNLPK